MIYDFHSCTSIIFHLNFNAVFKQCAVDIRQCAFKASFTLAQINSKTMIFFTFPFGKFFFKLSWQIFPFRLPGPSWPILLIPLKFQLCQNRWKPAWKYYLFKKLFLWKNVSNRKMILSRKNVSNPNGENMYALYAI